MKERSDGKFNIEEETKETREIAHMFSKLDKSLKTTTKGMIKGMLMAQEAYEKQEQSKESA